MRTGFWNVVDEKHDNEFNFLKEGIMVWKRTISPYKFLEGMCHSFAAALKYEYGYAVECIVDDDGKLIHSYAVTEINGKVCYVDVRGINSDWNDFISYYSNVLPTIKKDKLNIVSLEKYYENEFEDPEEDYTEIISVEAEDLIDFYEEQGYYTTNKCGPSIMKIEFSSQIAEVPGYQKGESIYINIALFQNRETGDIIEIDRDETEFSINKNMIEMLWRGVYVWDSDSSEADYELDPDYFNEHYDFLAFEYEEDEKSVILETPTWKAY